MYKYLIEFFGTAAVIYVLLATKNVFAVGASYVLAMLVGGRISGGYMNPAATIALVAAGSISARELIPYLVSQVLGALVALELFRRYTL